MTRVLIACVGGFLGAGKTRALASASGELIARGFKVGVITNDQGNHLIDTEVMRSLGLPTEEIAGGCFCCRFDEFVEHAGRILDQGRPDIILAEAVGSCTDLSATVLQPLHQYYADQFQLAPLSILAEPSRVRAFSDHLSNSFPENVAYLFEKQLAEADLIILNKSDLIEPGERKALAVSIQNRLGNLPVHSMSALMGWGVAGWIDQLLSGRTVGHRILEIDYETYAQAEASLGWLNATVDITASRDFSPRELGTALIRQIQQGSVKAGAEIAHLKVLVATAEGSDRIAITDNQGQPQWSGDAKLRQASEASIIVNARISTSPEELRDLIEDSLSTVAAELRVKVALQHLESFSPAPPKPRYRLEASI